MLAFSSRVSAAVPDSLTAAEWRDIGRQVVARRYQADSVENGFVAANPAHGFAIRYRADGSTELKAQSAGQAPGSAAEHRIVVTPTALGYGAPDANLNLPQQRTADIETVTTQWRGGLREWWDNTSAGVEQWFELAAPPDESATDAIADNHAPLLLRLRLETTLAAELRGEGDAQHLRLHDNTTEIRFEKLLVSDASGRRLPASMRLSGNELAYVIDDRNAVYPVRIDPTFVQRAYLKASNTDALDEFGNSVAVAGDIVVVGAPFEDSSATGVDGDQADKSATDAGAAYLFVRDGNGVWSQQAYLKASNTGSGDLFGNSVAVAGDIVVVGAPFEQSNATGIDGDQADNSMTGAGAAYIFVRDDNGAWAQQAYLKPSNTGGGDQFGFSVAVAGDTVVVGARREDSSATGVGGDQTDNSLGLSGAAYVFVRDDDGIWTQQAYLKASNPDFWDEFGVSVAVDGDTVVIGANREDSSATGVGGDQTDNSLSLSGAAYVFVRDDNDVWSQQAYVKASNTGGNDLFGVSVAVVGDTVVVGAAAEDSRATGVDGDQNDNAMINSGAAYVFVRNGNGVWTQQAYLKASNPNVTDLFGASVAVTGDTVAVGAYSEDSSATGIDGEQTDNSAQDAGAAYVFVRDGNGGWSQRAYLKASGTGTGDRFGYSVAVAGDTVAVGALGEDSSATGVDGNQADNSASRSGAAYVFIRPTFTIGGTVSGLTLPGMVLDLNGTSLLLFERDGGFTFPVRLSDGTDYIVTAPLVPDDHDCVIANATGTINGADVTDVSVTCTTDIEFADNFETLQEDPVEL